MAVTASDVINLVKTMGVMDIEEIGSSTAVQDANLITYLNIALKELAHIAYVVRVSDALTIIADGYQTFLRSTAAITDMYSPLRILSSTGTETDKRTAYSAPVGWWRESANTAIHTKGLTGANTLQYVAYPATVVSTSSPVEFPDVGIVGLAYWMLAAIKESRNAMEESQDLQAKARARFKRIVLANQAARGFTSVGYVPNTEDIDNNF